MKKVIELVMFNENDEKVMSKVLDTKTIKALAQIKRIDELEYDCDAMVRLNDSIVDITNQFAKVYNNVHHFIIYNDYSENYELYNIGNNQPVKSF